MLKAYLLYRKEVLLFFLAVISFFPLIHYLFGLPMESMRYSIIILAFLLALWMVVDGSRFYQRIYKLDEILNHLSPYTPEFPEQENLQDGKYQEIITNLYEMHIATKAEMDKSHAEQIEYFTMWVHQIKTPISAMRLALQSADDAGPILEQELFKIERYAEMVLHYVKLGNLASDMVITEYPLEKIVRQSVKRYAALFIYKKLTIEIGTIDAVVLTDSKWLSFMIEQFISNAVKYTPVKGKIKVYMKKNALIIEDTGMGIRAEDVNRVFEKGYTGYNGRVDKRASGLGLYLTKKVADALAIKVWLLSQVGSGTKVILSFPEQKCIWD